MDADMTAPDFERIVPKHAARDRIACGDVSLRIRVGGIGFLR
jgi:hypothetical protein